MKVIETLPIERLPDDPRIRFFSDSQDVAPIRADLGPGAEEYDSFFVHAADGAIWGIHGIIPNTWKMADRLR